MKPKRFAVAAICAALLLAAACNTEWTKTASAILKAAQPTVHNIVPDIERYVVAAIAGLDSWHGDAAALANISSEVQAALDNLDGLLPGLSEHDRQLAVWVGSGLESVLAVIQQNVPQQAQARAAPAVKARAARPKYPTYPDAAAYKKAKPK